MAAEHSGEPEIQEDDKAKVEEATKVFKEMKVGSEIQSDLSLGSHYVTDKSQLMGMKDVFTTHFYLLQEAKGISDPLDRMIQVAKYYLSCVTPGEFGKGAIPSTQGETYRGTFVTPGYGEGDQSPSVFVAEQISHNPSMSAGHLHNEKDGVEIDITAFPSGHFWGTHVAIMLRGTRIFRLKGVAGGADEEYTVEWPDMYVRLLRFHNELVGTPTIACAQSGYKAELKFKAKPLVFGHWHSVEGHIVHESDPKKHVVEIEGRYFETVTFTNTKTKANSTLERKSLARSQFSLTNDPTSSENVWGEVFEHYKKGEHKAADKAKQTVEQQHKDALKNGNIPPVQFFEKISCPQGVYTYRAPSPQDKTKWLSQIRGACATALKSTQTKARLAHATSQSSLISSQK